MMPDLGKYATEVLSAYGVSIVLLALIVVLSVRRAARIRARLEQVEARAKQAQTLDNAAKDLTHV